MGRERLQEIEGAQAVDGDAVPELVIAARPDDPHVAALDRLGIERYAAVHVAKVVLAGRLEVIDREARTLGFVEDGPGLRGVRATGARGERDQHERGDHQEPRDGDGRGRGHGCRSSFVTERTCATQPLCGQSRSRLRDRAPGAGGGSIVQGAEICTRKSGHVHGACSAARPVLRLPSLPTRLPTRTAARTRRRTTRCPTWWPVLVICPARVGRSSAAPAGSRPSCMRTCRWPLERGHDDLQAAPAPLVHRVGRRCDAGSGAVGRREPLGRSTSRL